MTDTQAGASEKIDRRIAEFDDWRGEVLATVRRVIRSADPEITEEWKWVKATNPGVPVWECAGGICTGEVYKAVVKLTFFKGRPWRTPPACSTPVSRARCAGPSTSRRATRSTRRR